MKSLLHTNNSDKWNVLSNPQFLSILFYLVELKYSPKNVKNNKKLSSSQLAERSNKVLMFYQKLSKFWVGRTPDGFKETNKKPMDQFSKKVPTKVIKFLCQEKQFEKALRIIEQLLMK